MNNKKGRKLAAAAGRQGTAKDAAQLIFVVQRHDASHLHYDFRLELNGVLKSWAVPKGPSMNPKDKRLAMMVDDHPLAYASFEGEIPAGSYGAGQVKTWDRGTYEPLDGNGAAVMSSAFAKNLMDGNISFRMNGKLLSGDFALVRMKKDEKAWLLIKHRDKYATDDVYDSEHYVRK